MILRLLTLTELSTLKSFFPPWWVNGSVLMAPLVVLTSAAQGAAWWLSGNLITVCRSLTSEARPSGLMAVDLCLRHFLGRPSWWGRSLRLWFTDKLAIANSPIMWANSHSPTTSEQPCGLCVLPLDWAICNKASGSTQALCPSPACFTCSHKTHTKMSHTSYAHPRGAIRGLSNFIQNVRQCTSMTVLTQSNTVHPPLFKRWESFVTDFTLGSNPDEEDKVVLKEMAKIRKKIHEQKVWTIVQHFVLQP